MKLVIAFLSIAAAFACGLVDESVFQKYTDSETSARLMRFALVVLLAMPAGFFLGTKVKYGRAP